MIAPDLETARWFIEHHGAPNSLCVAITGAHAYGFPSADSDLDVKGIHIAPTAALVSLTPPLDSIDTITELDGVEIDYTSHELGFALKLLLQGNGNVLERILSPFQIVRSDRREWLQGLTRAAVCRKFFGHYRGFFARMRDECRKATARRAKDYLYAYRTALTGAHLLRTGECVLAVEVLAREYEFPAVAELLAVKRDGTEQQTVADVSRYEADWPRLEAQLDLARVQSPLPELAPNADALSAFVVEERRRHF